MDITRHCGIIQPPLIPDTAMLVATAYLRLLLKTLSLDAAAEAELLTGSGIAPDNLFSLHSHLSLDGHLDLLRKIMELRPEPGFALRVGQQLHIATHGPIGVAAYTSSTLGEALSTIARFYSIRGQFIDIGLHSDGEFLSFTLRLRTVFNDTGLFLLEAFLASAQTGIEFITGAPLREGRLELGYPAPAHAALYHEHFHMPVRFGCAETSLILPIRLLQTSSLHADPVAKLQAEQQCEQQFKDLQQAPSAVSTRIVTLLRANPGRLWTLPEVAEALNLSARTLMRRLKEEGQSYQALHDAELHRQARIHLQDKRHTTESLALALGYSDTSGFRRAFQRWFGMSVREYLDSQDR